MLGALLLSLLLSPTGAAAPAVHLASPPLRAGPGAALALLSRDLERPFSALAAANGRVLRLYGGRLPLTGAGDARARAALQRLAAVFEIPVDYTVGSLRELVGGAVDARFAVAGRPVFGTGLRLFLDQEGALLGALALGPFPEGGPGGAELFDATLESAARAAARVLPAGRSPPTETWLTVAIERGLFAAPGELVPAARVRLVGLPAGASLVVDLDARDGTLLRRTPLHSAGQGLYPWFGQFVSFPTGKAKGRVFPSVDAALLGTAGKKKLKGWSKGVPNPVGLAKGFLTGAHVDVFDDNGNDPFSPSGQFFADPYGADADVFDATQLYYEMESYASWLAKKAPAYGAASNFSIPAVVNSVASQMNAFFSPASFPDGHTTGFFIFFDLQAALSDLNADAVRDPAVIDHEYTHAALFYAGGFFQDDIDTPTRAVGEAVPDFGAVSHQDDSVIGRVLESVLPGQGLLRDLQDGDVFPTTTQDAMGLTQSGLPEEHRNGEIFGSFLVDLRGRIGESKAMKLLFDAVPMMPPDLASIGYGSYTPANALDATSDYFGRCAFALLLADPKEKFLEDVIGTATARGIFGSPIGIWQAIVNLEAFSKRKVTIPSRILGGLTTHIYLFRAKQGRKLTVKVLGAKSGTVLPDFTITDDQGDPAAVTHTQSKTFSKNGRLVVEKGIVLQLPLGKTPQPGDGYYVLTLTTPSGSSGAYKITLDA